MRLFGRLKDGFEDKLRSWGYKSNFGRSVYRAYLDMKGPAFAKEPSLASKIFKKTILYGLAITLAAGGILSLGGNRIQKIFRDTLGEKNWTLDLNQTKEIDEDNPKPPLFIGSTEVARIIDLQENLLTLGYPLDGCGANGQLNKQDMKAVNAFRVIVGNDTTSEYIDIKTEQMIARQAEQRVELKKMFSSKADQAPDAVTFQPSIFMPNTSEKDIIRHIQSDLLITGYSLSECMLTGVMDQATADAVIAFKRDHKIYPATGTVDPEARSALREAAKDAAKEKGIEEIAELQGEDYLSTVLYGQRIKESEIQKIVQEYMAHKKVPEYIVQDILFASTQTGMDFTYMMDMGSIESAHKPWAEADGSSATGSFQFTKGTWMSTFKKHATKYGPYTDLIRDMNKSETAKQHILHMRTDPKMSALMAAEFALENMTALRESGISNIGKTELYIAHFLGSSGAAKFIKEFRKDPNRDASSLFPEAAKANPAVFNGKTLGEVYKNFAKKMTGNVLRMTERKPQPQKTAALLQNLPAVSVPIYRMG
jgi:N-acetyl-anhydromuramyl-L-alanine amidase AmpD